MLKINSLSILNIAMQIFRSRKYNCGIYETYKELRIHFYQCNFYLCGVTCHAALVKKGFKSIFMMAKAILNSTLIIYFNGISLNLHSIQYKHDEHYFKLGWQILYSGQILNVSQELDPWKISPKLTIHSNVY